MDTRCFRQTVFKLCRLITIGSVWFQLTVGACAETIDLLDQEFCVLLRYSRIALQFFS